MESQLRWPSCVKPRGIRTTAITVVGSTWPASTRSGTTHVALISWTVCPRDVARQESKTGAVQEPFWVRGEVVLSG